MSGDYTDVLTNQPVVIDNVGHLFNILYTIVTFSIGVWYNQSWFCWPRTSKMLFSFVVRVLSPQNQLSC